MAYKVIIVDDHDLVRNGISKIISEDASFEVVGNYSETQGVVDCCLDLMPDIALLDIDLNGENGMQLAEKILKSNPDQRIAFLSMHHEKSMVRKAMDLGVEGYLVKSIDPEEFIYALKQICKGKRFFHSEVITSYFEEKEHVPFHQDRKEKARFDVLSKRELEVTKLIVQGKSNKEIGESLFLSTRTVETHRKKIYEKLEVNNLTELVRLAIKAGVIN